MGKERMSSWHDLDVDSVIIRFRQLKDFAFSPHGLDLSMAAARKWAEARMLSWDGVDLPAFIDRFDQLKAFAFASSGLDLSMPEARTWAAEEACREFELE
jgi:hypothetical protein